MSFVAIAVAILVVPALVFFAAIWAGGLRLRRGAEEAWKRTNGGDE